MDRFERVVAVALAAVFLFGFPAALAQADGAPDSVMEASAPQVADLAWLAGHWRGEGFGGIVEEVWTPPLAGSMLGMFRHIKEGKLAFQEIVMLTEEDGVVTMKVKHFTPEFVSWESKEEAVDFRLERLGNREAFFRGLTFQSPDEDTLIIKIVLHYKKEGVTRQETLSLKRYSGDGSRD